MAEQRTRGGFERQRLDGLAVETKEGLRWASGGDREGFGWVDDEGRKGIRVTVVEGDEGLGWPMEGEEGLGDQWELGFWVYREVDEREREREREYV